MPTPPPPPPDADRSDQPAPEHLVVRRPRRRRRRRRRLLGGVAAGLVVAAALAALGASRSEGPRPSIGTEARVGPDVDPLPSAGCAPPADPAAPGRRPSDGDEGLPSADYPTLVEDTGVRAYRFVPAVGSTTGAPPGLLLVLPDAGRSAEDTARTTGLELVAAVSGFSVATLEPVPPERILNASQEVGRPDDLLHAVRVIEDVAARRCVDLRRIHAVGEGVGGRMAGALACVRPEYLASVVSVGDAFLADPCPLDPPVSLLAVGGTQQPPAGPPADPATDPRAVATRWAERLGAVDRGEEPGPAASPVEGSTVRRWTGGRSAARVELVLVPDLGDLWPGWFNETLVARVETLARPN